MTLRAVGHLRGKPLTRGATTSGSDLALASEQNGLSIDFTDNAFLGSTGQYGSATVKITSDADWALRNEGQGLAIVFTDTSLYSTTGQYGSASVK